MPAAISPILPEQAVAAGKFALNGNDAVGGPTNAELTDANPFAALFQKILKAQGGSAELDPALLGSFKEDVKVAGDPALLGSINKEDAKVTAENEPVGDLAALLPFLEAVGLAQNGSPVTSSTSGQKPNTGKNTDALIQSADESLTDNALPDTDRTETDPTLIVAAALPAPVINDTPAITAADSQRSGPLDQLAPTGMDKSTALGIGQPGAQLPAGTEFSEQLVSAIKANKDEPHEPNGMATTVQQVIAHVSPRQSDADTTAHAIAQPVGSTHWNEEVGNRVVWMANHKESQAELVLTPPQMGRVEVKLSISGDQATATFVSANPQVREALEAALPRLREILADAGVQLGQAQVGSENAGQSAQERENRDNFAFAHGSAAGDDQPRPGGTSGGMTAGFKSGRGLVDVFA